MACRVRDNGVISWRQVGSNNRFDRDCEAISFGEVSGGSMIEINELRFGSRAPRRGQPER